LSRDNRVEGKQGDRGAGFGVYPGSRQVQVEAPACGALKDMLADPRWRLTVRASGLDPACMIWEKDDAKENEPNSYDGPSGFFGLC